MASFSRLSSRRILGSDGKIQYVRRTATTNLAVREYPEGIVDPMMKSISFWDNDHAVAVLTYFPPIRRATTVQAKQHPISLDWLFG